MSTLNTNDYKQTSSHLHGIIKNLEEENAKLQGIRLQLESREKKLNIENNNLQSENQSLKQSNLTLSETIAYLEHQLALLKKKQFGSSSEKNKAKIKELEERIEAHDCDRGLLEAQCKKKQDSEKKKSLNKPKRKKLPDNLPREEIVIPAPQQCDSCDSSDLHKIGEDISEILEYVPGYFKVKKYIRPRVVCKSCENIMQAEPASKTIDKGIAGPGLLSHIIIQKYAYHIPLYRQQIMYQSLSNVDLARSSMSGWVGKCAVLLALLAKEIKKYVMSSSQIHGDETPVNVLSPGHGKTKKGRLWCYVSDGRPHGSKDPPAAYYCYSENRKAQHPLSHLENYKGVLHADAYQGFRKLYEDDTGVKKAIIESSCWAHMRRKFYDVVVSNKNAKIAQEVVERIGKIYDIESEVRGFVPDKRLRERQSRSKMLVYDLFKFMKDIKDKLPQKGCTAMAIKYALNKENSLKYFLNDGKAEIDNNAAERALRCVAVGRKNWLFAGSDNGGHASASIYSVIETAKLNDMNPWQYLSYVLSVIQDYNSSKLADLLPWNVELGKKEGDK